MSKYEQPEYKVVLSQPPFELRLYDEFIVVEYNNEKDPKIEKGFGTLFRYISNDNENKQKLSMTIPVIEEVVDDQMKMAFVVPKAHWENAPKPNSELLSLKKFGGGLFAVIKYGGRSNENMEKNMKQKLSEWIEVKGYRAISNHMLAFYNPPFVPGVFRRNEIMIRIEI
ncbi:heme-binding protein [Alkalibacter rhizosphaerae]|uniref:Heme-binding protein n=1 Tax=Alkalibacter rhizosphaerae TaxID=2815577 RepID=A0A975AI70_9FIRM|nr:heme-binding protein [Alkalibacter rhizosphaerae]QSX08230.1 heme-binding protein [Alkalibacter rhizosphaerae]